MRQGMRGQFPQAIKIAAAIVVPGSIAIRRPAGLRVPDGQEVERECGAHANRSIATHADRWNENRARGHADVRFPNGDPMSYTRFAAMIATSTVVMFGLMYATIYSLDHVWWSETRFWMALFMGAMMAIIMLAFMLGMYTDRRKNIAIFAGGAIVFVTALFLARSQETVEDVAWMKAMIPHHSIAILTSERAEISDPRVRALADEIIEAQRREIAEMEALIASLENE